MDRLGIDIGSKTIKVVLVSGEDGSIVYSDYLYHRSKVRHYLLGVLHDCVWRFGNREVEVAVTGSAGLRVSELFGIPYVQEVVALKRAVETLVPDCDVVLEMGGEDTKLIYLTGVPEQRMNTVCAGGTGGFIEMMAGLMGVRAEKMQMLAMGHTTVYPIASRCAVFAKSDVRPLINGGARKSDIAMSVLEAVCTQAVAGLSAGRPIEGRVALLGGPFHHIPYMHEAFCRVTGISRKDAVIPVNAHLFVAMGAAFMADASCRMMTGDLEQLVANTDFADEAGIKRLPPLFESSDDYAQFVKRHSACKLRRVDIDKADRNLFMGIDAGSTTVKVALVDATGALCAYEYGWNEGDVLESLPDMLETICRKYTNQFNKDKMLRRSCVVGYGEDLCKAGFKVDSSEVETVAHLRAAREVEPQVDFLLDIGGQDIKCFYIKDGCIEDIVLNEACSSGCGSLFDSIARSVRMSKEAFAQEAVSARSPVDLGTRCSTFMDSRVKHAQKDGVLLGDIAAGVSWSTARNALYKVVRQPDFSKVGEHIVVQGGAFANDALLRAFELETDREVLRPDLAEIMGAYGAALLARDEWLELRERDTVAAEEMHSSLISLDKLKNLTVKKRATRCNQCPNNCSLMITRFVEEGETGEERSFVQGNRCEKGAMAFSDVRKRPKRPPNSQKYKRALIGKCDFAEQPCGNRVIGIPKVLSLYESYPFWKSFFNALGYTVLKGHESDAQVFRCGMGSIPSEGACYPSKLVYGHCVDLVQSGADTLFVPDMGLGFAQHALRGENFDSSLRECPLIEHMGTLVVDNTKGTMVDQAQVMAPGFRGAKRLDDIVEPLCDALHGAGLACNRDTVVAALEQARTAFSELYGQVAAFNEELLARIDAGELRGALVVGHPYHADPGISHGIDDLLGDLGFAVVDEIPAQATHAGQWVSNARLLDSASALEEHPNLQLIDLRSFGCGIDALAADSLSEKMHRANRVYAELKIDQIVDLAAVRIRLRSLDYAARQRQGLNPGI